MGGQQLLSEADGGALHNSRPSIFSELERGLELNPIGAAAICMSQPANHLNDIISGRKTAAVTGGKDCLVLSYVQILATALELASGLQKIGVTTDSTILVAIDNGAEYILLMWTCAILRLTLVAIDPSMIDAADRKLLDHHLQCTKPGLIVLPDQRHRATIDKSITRLQRNRPIYLSLSEGSNQALSLRELSKVGQIWPCDVEETLKAARNDDPDRIHTILFTSGTSGKMPKGCPIRVKSMTQILQAQDWLIHSKNCRRVLQQAHISRAIGPQHMLQTFRCGGTMVMPQGPSFCIDHTLEAILKHKVTFVVLSPPMVYAIERALSASPGATNCVRSVQVGGAAVTKSVMEKCSAVFPRADVFVNHGMSEGGAVFRWPFFGRSASQLPYFGSLCPTGGIAPGTKLKIWDEKSKSSAIRGDTGQLHICSGSLITEYLHGESPSSFYAEGEDRWFNTGDLAVMNGDGTVYVLGRAQDAITRSAKLMVPSVLESCIEAVTGDQVSERTHAVLIWSDADL